MSSRPRFFRSENRGRRRPRATMTLCSSVSLSPTNDEPSSSRRFALTTLLSVEAKWPTSLPPQTNPSRKILGPSSQASLARWKIVLDQDFAAGTPKLHEAKSAAIVVTRDTAIPVIAPTAMGVPAHLNSAPGLPRGGINPCATIPASANRIRHDHTTIGATFLPSFPAPRRIFHPTRAAGNPACAAASLDENLFCRSRTGDQIYSCNDRSRTIQLDSERPDAQLSDIKGQPFGNILPDQPGIERR